MDFRLIFLILIKLNVNLRFKCKIDAQIFNKYITGKYICGWTTWYKHFLFNSIAFFETWIWYIILQLFIFFIISKKLDADCCFRFVWLAKKPRADYFLFIKARKAIWNKISVLISKLNKYFYCSPGTWCKFLIIRITDWPRCLFKKPLSNIFLYFPKMDLKKI